MIQIFYFRSSTGKRLFGKKWYNDRLKKYKGVVQLVHGMEENISRYSDFANFLAANGFIVVGHDHIGHGQSVESEAELGHLDCKDGWARMTDDIHILQNKIKEEYPDIPYFIMGHSMGSLLVRTYATIYDDDVTGLILSGTSGKETMLHLVVFLAKTIELFKGEKHKSKLLDSLVTGSFNKKFKPTRTEMDWLTSDDKAIDKYLMDINPKRKFTVESYKQMFMGSIYLSKKNNIKNMINIPILLLSGDKDPVGENGKGVKRVFNMLKKVGIDDVTLKLFKDGRHELLNEVNKDEVYNFILNWIMSRI